MGPWVKLLCKYAPETASIMYTQYTRNRTPEHAAWRPEYRHELEPEENICTMTTAAMMCRPWANYDTGQQVTSVLGTAGAGKTSLIKLNMWIFDRAVIKVAETDAENTFGAFCDTSRCYVKNVFPEAAFVTKDRKDRWGSYIPEPLLNEVIGEEGLAIFSAADKYVRSAPPPCFLSPRTQTDG